MTPETFIETRLKVHVINDGLAKLPVVSRPVYRGLSNVSRDVMQRWMEKFSKGEPIGLGVADKPGLASASWQSHVATSFATRSNFLGLGGGQYGVIFELHNHRGVGIEKISRFAGESEVLIPGDRLFKIESIGLLKDFEGIFHIKLKAQ